MNDTLDRKIRYRTAVARAHSQTISGNSATLMVKETPVYSGRASQILPIVLSNLVLTFLTLGLYRFWAKTRIRRYFISRVSFLGDPLEYAGTGMELFKGFLIVLAIMVPVLIAAGAVQQFILAPSADALGAVIFQAGYILAFFFLYYAARYRAQRYRLSRTSWRGIRGGQQGSALIFALCAMGLGLLTLLTLGLAQPVKSRVLAGYRINHTCIGTEPLRLNGGLGKLFAGWLVPWLLFMAILGLFGYAAWQQDLEALARENPEAIPDLLRGMFSGGSTRLSGSIVLALALVPACFVAWIWYSAFEARVWINNTRFDRLEFKSHFSAIHALVPYLAYVAVLCAAGLAVLVLLGLGFTARHNLAEAAVVKYGLLLTVYAAIAGVWILAVILKPLVIYNWLIGNFCKTTSIQGTFSPDRLFQSQLQIPRHGEGLADALDIDAF